MLSHRIDIAALVGLASLLLGTSAAADTIDLRIVSDSTWRTSASLEANWTEIGFDHSAWASARAPYPSDIAPADLVPGTTGQFIWHDPAASSNGQNGSIEAYLRVSFTLDLVGANAPLAAQADISVDDDYELYVNGELVLQNHDGGFAGQVDSIDIAPWLRHGPNVIAIHGIDGSWDFPRDRGYERVLFDAHITSVPRINISLRSSEQWRSSATAATGWTTVDFDDSQWPFARAPYPGAVAATLMADTAAASMWHDPDDVSNGSNGPNEAFFRYRLTIPGDPALLPVVAKMRLNADDDYNLYVNGMLVLENHDEGFADVIDTVDFTYALRAGQNVIAIHAVDGGWSAPYDRGNERLIVDGLVASGVLDWDFVGIANMEDYFCIVGPALDHNKVVFTATAPFEDCVTPALFSTAGVYAVDVPSGTSEVIVQDDMVLPDGTGVFSIPYAYLNPSVDGDNVAFKAQGVDAVSGEVLQSGVYARIDGTLRALATTSTPIPAGTGNFTDMAPLGPSLDGTSVVFHGNGTGQQGVYTDRGGLLHTVADLTTAVPLGGGGVFAGFERRPDVDGARIAFAGCSAAIGPCSPGDEHDGVFLYDDDLGTFSLIVNTFSLMPASPHLFEVIYYHSHKDGIVAFSGRGGPDSGIYAWQDGGITIIADSNTPLPGGDGLFSWWDFLFVVPSTDSGNVAFSVTDRGIYTNIGMSLSEVINSTEDLPGIFPFAMDFESLHLDEEGLSRNSIAFRAEQHGGAGSALVVAVDAFGFIADADGDGIADTADNCLLAANGAQSDTDADGYGNACDPDFNGDGNVNFADLQQMKSVFFSNDADADLNQDGMVNFADLSIMKALFFGPPGPSALVN